jgi:hypothetical protein
LRFNSGKQGTEMTVFLNRADFTEPNSVTSDLQQIAANEGILQFHTNVQDPSKSEITFQLTSSSDIGRQLDQLFRVAAVIVITGLSSDSEDPTTPDKLIAGNGVTFDANGVIHVAYDVGQCNGDGIWTIGIGGNPIPTPNPVILYHELAHALRFANGQHSDDSNIEERAAEIQENLMRTKMGVTLRDVNNHFGGCGIVSGGGGGQPDKPVPVVSCVAVPEALNLDNHIDVSWQVSANYNFYLVLFGVAGQNLIQAEIDSSGRSGSFRIRPTVPGTVYSVQVDGCFSHILDSDCSGFSKPILVTAAANLHSVVQFCRLSGVDPSQGVHHVLAPAPFSVISLRNTLGI